MVQNCLKLSTPSRSTGVHDTWMVPFCWQQMVRHVSFMRSAVWSMDVGEIQTHIRIKLTCLTITSTICCQLPICNKGKGSPYSITKCSVAELIPVLGSQPAGDVNHKPDGRLPLLFARPAVTPATLKRAATNFVVW